MAEVDPLILEISANLDRYKSELRSSTALVTNQLGRQEKAVQNLERQMQRSSGAIAGNIRGMAAALAGAFTGRELVGLLDNFTRLQNSLRVAGLEGQSLASVQGDLLELSSKYGVSINELADLYGKSSQAASDLGASESQLLQITGASAQALKITGTSAVQAQGALLGLTQALSSGTVRAEEFNQINEGGLRPLLQVAANAEKYGGSVAKLRQAVVDGKVSSQEFYTAILNGSTVLEGQASKATLTLSGAFAALGSNLTVYAGEASAANGVTAALAAGIGALADNLDTIIPALAIIASAIGVNYVAGLVAATRSSILLSAANTGTAASMGVLGSATFAMQARLAGAATTAEALGFAMSGLGAALPILAISAFVLGVGYLITESNNAINSVDGLTKAAADAETQADAMEARLREAGVALEAVANSGENAASGIDATSRAASQAQSRLKALEDQAGVTALKLNQLNLIKAQGDRDVLAARIDRSSRAQKTGKFSGLTQSPAAIQYRADNDAALAAKDREIAALRRQTGAIVTGIKAGVNVAEPAKAAVRNSVAPKKDGSKKRTSAAPDSKGPDAAEVTKQFESKLLSAQQQELQARIAITSDINDRADLEKELLASQRAAAIGEIDSDKNLSAERKAALKELVDSIYGQASTVDDQTGIMNQGKAGLLAIAINRDVEGREAQEAADIAQARNDQQSSELQVAYDMAKTQEERRTLAYQIIEAEFDHLKSIQEAVIASDLATEAQKEIARLKLAQLDAERSGQLNRARQDTAGPLERYATDLSKSAGQLNEDFQAIAVDGLEALNNGIADAIVNSKDLGDVFKNVAKSIIADLIRIAIQQVIVNSLMSAFGGGGGSSGVLSTIGKAVGGVFGRASGGPVQGGNLYRVNESQQEFFKPDQNGKILTMSQMRNQMAANSGGQSGGVTVVRLELSGDIDARIQSQSAEVAVQVVQAAAPQIRDAAVSETFRRGNRPGFRK